MVAKRKFFWFFSHLDFYSPEGSPLGSMVRRFKIIGRRFDVYDDQEQVGSIHGPMLRPNTFWLRRDGNELAKITKRWSGLSREMFTAATPSAWNSPTGWPPNPCAGSSLDRPWPSIWTSSKEGAAEASASAHSARQAREAGASAVGAFRG